MIFVARMAPAIVICVCLIASRAMATEWHVAPNGTMMGDGSAEKPWDLETALKKTTVVQPGDTVWLHGGTYTGAERGTFTCTLKGTEEKPILVKQFPGERATVQPTLTTDKCEYVWLWGFEVMNPDTNEYGRIEHSRLPAVWLATSVGVKLINMVIHDGGQGIGAWSESEDSEICGCIIYNNGWAGSNQGHGIYTQNRAGTKTIRDNVIFNQLGDGYGIHCYGSEKAYVQNYVFEGNVCFDNKGNDMLIGGGRSSENIVVRNNFAYGRGGVRFGYEAHNKDAIIRDNYFATRCRVKDWDTLEFKGNTFCNPGEFMILDIKRPDALPKYDWDGNAYFRPPAEAPLFTLISNDGTSSFDFDQWKQKTGFDATSTFSPAKPTGLRVFVRPNAYEPARAHIIVYNWDGKDAVEVDLSAMLKPGDAYELRDTQNVLGTPVMKGVYAGGTVPVPMKLTEVAQPVTQQKFEHTSPEFNVFVLTKAVAQAK
jgi:hypothetical protein